MPQRKIVTDEFYFSILKQQKKKKSQFLKNASLHFSIKICFSTWLILMKFTEQHLWNLRILMEKFRKQLSEKESNKSMEWITYHGEYHQNDTWIWKILNKTSLLKSIFRKALQKTTFYIFRCVSAKTILQMAANKTDV